jgi:hypothetical protein
VKPTPATVQINGGPPITVTVDHVALTVDRPIKAIVPRLQLTMEFPLTPEFADWWRALIAQCSDGQVPAEGTVSAFCQADAHRDCRTGCRCWCHSTCPHVIPYLTSDNCESCGRAPEEMVPNPAEFRQGTAEARRQAAIRARLREAGEQR